MRYYSRDEMADIANDEARAHAEEQREEYLRAASDEVTKGVEALRCAARNLHEAESMGLSLPDEEGEFSRLGEIAGNLAALGCFLIEDVDKHRPTPKAPTPSPDVANLPLDGSDQDFPF